MNKRYLLFLLFILIIATVFETINLTKMSLWHDEAFSGLLLQYDLKEMIYRIGLDVHPPLYYLILKGWTAVLGNTLFTLRFFSVFFGILAVIFFYYLLKSAFNNQKLALFSSALLAFNSFFIQFAMEARMFTLGIFLVIISTFFLWKGLQAKKWIWWLFYAISVSLGLYTHYYIAFSVMGQAIFLIFWIIKEEGLKLFNWFKNRNFQFGLISYFLVLIAFLPWLKTFLSQMNQIEESYWIPPLNIWSIPATFLKLTTGGSIDTGRFGYVLIIFMVFVLAAFIFSLKKLGTQAKWLFFSMIIIPFLGATFFSLRASIFLDRYFIFTLPFYITLMAFAIIGIGNKKLQNILIFSAILGTLICFPFRWKNLEIEKKPGMAAAASYLNQEVKPGEKIYIGSSFVYFTFKYYNKTETSPKLYSPGTLSHFSGTALLNQNDYLRDFNQEVKKGDTVWMINTTGFGNWQPSLPQNWLLIKEKGFQDVYDYRGWIIVGEYQVL